MSSAAVQNRIPAILDAQRASLSTDWRPSATQRVERLQTVIDLLVSHHDSIVDALDADFGGRHPGFSILNDVLGSISALEYARDHVGEWMQAEPRPAFAPYDQLGATASIEYQPKGSVAIIGTWNAPVFTLLAPLASVLAAGNRAVLKPSEVVPRTADAIAAAFAEHFTPADVAVVTGGPEVAEALTSEPFDHIVFTGGTQAARSVMTNAARNLVPVTLELGGKSPVIIGRSADVEKAAFRIAAGKAVNSGQICVSPDTVHVPTDILESFVAALSSAYSELLPTVSGNADVTAVVNDRHLARVDNYIDDALARGVRIESTPRGEVSGADRRRPLRIVIDPPAEALISNEEIFGPALVVRGYDDISAVIGHVNAGPKPLALYYFGEDLDERRTVLDSTTSGGVTVNDVMSHPGMLDAPFGGVGNSGMGHYSGREGFLEFSHTRTVFVAADVDPRQEWGLLPPYTENFRAAVSAQVTA